MTADPRFARADALLASSGVVPTGIDKARPPRWPNPDGVGFREYRTEPATDVRVFVYAFPTERAAESSEPEIVKMLLDGSRAKVVRKGAFVFWVEAPLTLPGRPSAPATNQAFDAITAALARP